MTTLQKVLSLGQKQKWYEKGEKSNTYFYVLETENKSKHMYVVLLSITLKHMIKPL